MALVGVPFRPHGRDPVIGLDCLGLVICAFQLRNVEVPRYRLTDGDWDRVQRGLAPWFVQFRERRQGDLVVFRLPRCFHFGVLAERHLVHADLTLGQVVARPLPANLGREARYFRIREVMI